jgi:hypothetical protein
MATFGSETSCQSENHLPENYYGYNSSAVFGAGGPLLPMSRARQRICEITCALGNDKKISIFWLSHSLSGIVVKKAINNACDSGDYYKSIHDATRGVDFLRTPHRGGHLATLSDHMARICRVLSGNVRNNIMEAVWRNSMFEGDVARRPNTLELRILSFIENLPVESDVRLVSVLFDLPLSVLRR